MNKITTILRVITISLLFATNLYAQGDPTKLDSSRNEIKNADTSVLNKNDAFSLDSAIFFALAQQDFISSVMDFCASVIPEKSIHFNITTPIWRLDNLAAMITAESLSESKNLPYTYELDETSKIFASAQPDPKAEYVNSYCTNFTTDIINEVFSIEKKLPTTYKLLSEYFEKNTELRDAYLDEKHFLECYARKYSQKRTDYDNFEDECNCETDAFFESVAEDDLEKFSDLDVEQYSNLIDNTYPELKKEFESCRKK